MTSLAEHVALAALVLGVPVGAGLYAARSASNARFGVMLIGVGVLCSLAALGEATASLPYSIGRVAAWLAFAPLIYLMLAFPEGRLATHAGRAPYGGACVVLAVLLAGSALVVEAYPAQTPWATCRTDCPPNEFFLLGSEPQGIAGVAEAVRESLALVFLTGAAVALALRWHSATALPRRTLAPVAVASILLVAGLIAYLATRREAPGAEAVDTLALLSTVSVPVIAAAFAAGLVRRRLLTGEVLRRLSIALSRPLHGVQLRDALAEALGDPAVDVLVPDEVPGRWRDLAGRVSSRSAAAKRGHAVTLIYDDDVAAAALVHDPALPDDDELLGAVASLVLTPLRHQRLTTRLAASLAQLEDSRSRIARAADLERSRIERDLHDGAQQRLIMLRIRLSLTEELIRSDPAAGAEAARELGFELDTALQELRSIAHGVYPSLLSDRGLPDALRSVVSESPLPAHLQARGVTRLPPGVETAIYFTCVEALQNANKHASGATGLWISLRQSRALRFEVADDGAGFAPPGNDGGGGLRNMRDRVEAVGGRLTIDSSPGHGTRIRGLVPLR